jgi:death on curing protein
VAWKWISSAVAVALHDEQLAQHGGGAGARDLGLLESALARAQNLVAYGDPDAAALAAAYAYGIARNHPFIDGNKRTAAVVSLTFLLVNSVPWDIPEADVVVTFLALAAGELSQEQLADWFRGHIVAR